MKFKIFRFTKFDPHLTNLLSRLDYDGFYSSYLWNQQSQGMGGNFGLFSK